MDHLEWDADRSRQTPDDSVPVVMTHYQVLKACAIITAALRGQEHYREAAADALWFLQMSAADATDATPSGRSQQVWERVDQVMWPYPKDNQRPLP